MLEPDEVFPREQGEATSPLRQAEAQRLSYQIAREWYADVNLRYGGVSFGRVMEYEIMHVLGFIFKGHMDAQRIEQEAHGHGTAG